MDKTSPLQRRSQTFVAARGSSAGTGTGLGTASGTELPGFATISYAPRPSWSAMTRRSRPLEPGITKVCPRCCTTMHPFIFGSKLWVRQTGLQRSEKSCPHASGLSELTQ